MSKAVENDSEVEEADKKKGWEAIEKFSKLVAGARQLPDGDVAGDFVVTVDGRERPVEVKQCSKAKGTRQIYQVRAVRYVPCVVHDLPRDSWYVFPPDALVVLAWEKQLGAQHTALPYESGYLPLGKTPEERWSDFLCGPDQLASRVADAVRSGDAATQMKAAMESLRSELTTLREKYDRIIQGVRGF